MTPGIALSDADDRAQHLSAIESLAELHRVPADTVAQLYEGELSRFRRDALITNYLAIFVSRRVAELLRAMKSSSLSGPPPDSPVQ